MVVRIISDDLRILVFVVVARQTMHNGSRWTKTMLLVSGLLSVTDALSVASSSDFVGWIDR